MPEAPPLLVAGSIALDTVEGPAGTIEDELGGSALYFALAASLITPVTIVAPVGAEDADRVRELVSSRRIDAGFLEVIDAPTYRWRAQQHEGRNIDLGSSDGIYDLWEPKVPAGYRGWAFVGSVRPDRQLQLVERLAGASLLAADSMISYIRARPPEARDVVRHAQWYFCTEEECRSLGGHDPESFRTASGLAGLVVKSGAAGVAAFTEGGVTRVPALSGHDVVDTTGAGDAVAAGMLAHWLATGARPGGYVESLRWGVACASLTIEDVGLRGIARATRPQLEERVLEVDECIRLMS